MRILAILALLALSALGFALGGYSLYDWIWGTTYHVRAAEQAMAQRDFVEAKGAKFLVGLQYSDPALIRHLQANRIPFVTFDGAAFYPAASAGAHWTPEGHKLVAERVLGLLSDNNIVPGEIRAPK